MTLRCFTAVLLPDEVRAAMRRVIDDLDAAFRALHLPPPRWERDENLHCTLNFFGGVPADRVEAFLAAVREHALPLRFPMRLRFAGLGAFPSHGFPRVLWIGISGDTAPLMETQQYLADIGRQLGMPGDDTHGFHPHVTIGKWKIPPRIDERLIENLHGADCGEVSVQSITLMRSVTQADGASYSVLVELPRGGGR